MQDYGGPVGFRLRLRIERVEALIIQTVPLPMKMASDPRGSAAGLLGRRVAGSFTRIYARTDRALAGSIDSKRCPIARTLLAGGHATQEPAAHYRFTKYVVFSGRRG